MSRESVTPLLEKMGRRLRPFWVFFGIIFGFGLMVLAGRWAGKQNLFFSYQRIYHLISPEGFFYPSLDNLTALVSHLAAKEKILVVVGGNSVFAGVGQKKEQLWTKELQRLLGEDFTVVNLAFSGALPMEMGGVVAEVLSKKYPRLIYVTDRDAPMAMGPPEGRDNYEYLFWQAQASGKLLTFAPRSDEIKRVFFGNDAKRRQHITEAALRGTFDYWTHASDLWNYLGYNFVFTVFNFLKFPEHFFEPRKISEDQQPDIPPIPDRFTLRIQSMQIIRTFARYAVEKGPNGELRIKPAVSEAFLREAREAIPDPYKPRTLVVLTYNAPYFARQLSEDEYGAYQFVYSQGKSWLQKAGYHSAVIGPELTDQDFADRVHLTSSGGQKMAHAVALQIQSMAVQLGYRSAGSNPSSK